MGSNCGTWALPCVNRRDEQYNRTTLFYYLFKKKFLCTMSDCIKHNLQGNMRPRRGQFPKPEYSFQEIQMDFIQLNKCNNQKNCW